jgi:hypothetical protein
MAGRPPSIVKGHVFREAAVAEGEMFAGLDARIERIRADLAQLPSSLAGHVSRPATAPPKLRQSISAREIMKQDFVRDTTKFYMPRYVNKHTKVLKSPRPQYQRPLGYRILSRNESSPAISFAQNHQRGPNSRGADGVPGPGAYNLLKY